MVEIYVHERKGSLSGMERSEGMRERVKKLETGNGSVWEEEGEEEKGKRRGGGRGEEYKV